MTPEGEALLGAWAAWDVRPGAPHTALAMEAACARFAKGESTLILRRYLAAAARAKHNRTHVIESWEDLYA